jgi:hypothetical protein
MDQDKLLRNCAGGAAPGAQLSPPGRVVSGDFGDQNQSKVEF